MTIAAWFGALAAVIFAELLMILFLVRVVKRQSAAVRTVLKNLEAVEAAVRARPLPLHAGVQSVRPDLPRPKGQ